MSQKNQDLILEKLEKLNLLDGVVSKLDQLTVTVNAVSSAVDLLAGKVQYNTDNIEFIRQEFDNFKTETRAELRSVKNTLNVREQQLRSAQVRVFNATVLTAQIYDRILRPLLSAAKTAGDLGSVPQVQNVVETCYRAFVQEEPEEGQPPPPVVIRFTNKQLKIAVLKQRRQSMPVPSEGEQKKGIKRFLIVEDLTPPAHKLLKAMQADPRTDKVWSVNGQIHYSIPGKSGFKKVRSVFDSIDQILS